MNGRKFKNFRYIPRKRIKLNVQQMDVELMLPNTDHCKIINGTISTGNCARAHIWETHMCVVNYRQGSNDARRIAMKRINVCLI